jgi:Protein of unknown function (DUF2845)
MSLIGYPQRHLRPAAESASVFGAMFRKLIPLLLTVTTGAAAQSFQCGNKLVSEGASPPEVVAKCGEPTRIDRSSIVRSSTAWIGNQAGVSNSAQVEIPVEVWLYNLGPDRLMEQLRFEGGRLVRIESLGFGYIEDGNN